MLNLRPHVYIVDDDEIMLWMFKELLQEVNADVFIYPSAEAFLANYQPYPVACLVCDLRMPAIGGLQVQLALKQLDSPLPIIFVSGNSDVRSAVSAMKSGAFDFIEKPVNGNHLIEKVQSALLQSRQRYTQGQEDSARQARLALLTPRERQIVAQLIEGKSSGQIASALDLSVRTVENHRARIKEKLHVSSTIDLFKLFL